MMIKFACPCGRTCRAKPENEGKGGTCPGCYRVFIIPGPGQVARYVDEPEDSASGRQAESAEAKPTEDKQGSATEQSPGTPWWRDPAVRKALLARDQEIQQEQVRAIEERGDIRARLWNRKPISEARDYKINPLPAAIEPGDRKALLARDQEIQQEMRRLGEEGRHRACVKIVLEVVSMLKHGGINAQYIPSTESAQIAIPQKSSDVIVFSPWDYPPSASKLYGDYNCDVSVWRYPLNAPFRNLLRYREVSKLRGEQCLIDNWTAESIVAWIKDWIDHNAPKPPEVTDPAEREVLLARVRELDHQINRLCEERSDARARINGFSKKTTVPTGASADTAEIPPFEQDSGTDINPDQERFFDQWKRRWDQGEAVDLGCNVGYLYTYARRHIKEPEDVIAQIPRLLSCYRGVSKNFTSLCQVLLSDYYVLNVHPLVRQMRTLRAEFQLWVLPKRTLVITLEHIIVRKQYLA